MFKAPLDHNPARAIRCHLGKQRRGQDRHQGVRNQAYIPPRIQGAVRLLLYQTSTVKRARHSSGRLWPTSVANSDEQTNRNKLALLPHRLCEVYANVRGVRPFG